MHQILDHIPYDSLSDTEIAALVPGTPASRYNQVKRALASKDLIQIKRGLYQLSSRYRRQSVNVYILSQKIYGPSYVSFESALSYHGLIPEAVHSISSACVKRARIFDTPVGRFEYIPIPIMVFLEDVERVEIDKQSFLMASPLKALTDYVYVNRLDWIGIKPILESLRIDREDLKL